VYPIRLVHVGRIKNEGCRLLEAHYLNLLKGYARLDAVEVPEGRGDPDKQLLEEADRIRRALSGIQCPVLLDAEGIRHNSESMAVWLGQGMDRGLSLGFVVGSSHGLHESLKREIKEKISLSPMTFPHELSRVMFLEQLYRSFTILRGKTYHK
jgi:23S rRNA (pseudouridine1915-N3)-methyltransferase